VTDTVTAVTTAVAQIALVSLASETISHATDDSAGMAPSDPTTSQVSSDHDARGPPAVSDVNAVGSSKSSDRASDEHALGPRLQPDDPTAPIVIDQSALDLIDGVGPIVVGGPNGSHLVTIGHVTVTAPLIISNPNPGGEVHITGAVSGGGSLTIFGSGTRRRSPPTSRSVVTGPTTTRSSSTAAGPWPRAAT